jgi:tetratricopeptide (TPR) repeat protein
MPSPSKHALTQQVAYETLLQERRRTLHAYIVEALEALAGERVAEQVERLAYHALRGEVWDKALAYFRQAGEKALVRSAHREAVRYFEQALSTLPHLPEQRDTRGQAIDLRLALRSALLASGDFGRILACLREAEALATALNDPRRLGHVSRFLANYFYAMGAHDQAIAAGQRALALATADADCVLQALANIYLGRAYQAQGGHGRAIDCYTQTVASLGGAQRYKRFGQAFLPVVQSRAFLAECHAELGTFAEGRTQGEEGLRIAEVIAHPGSLMWAYFGLGQLSLCQGNLRRALPRLEQAMGICQDADLPLFFPMIAGALGTAYTLGGRVADGISLLTQAMEQTIAMALGYLQARCHLSLGEAYLLAGTLEEALALAEHALTLAREHQERGSQAYALRLLGEIAAHHTPLDVDEAATHYRQALTLAEELGMRPLQARCYHGLGTLYVTVGLREQARTALTTAIALYRAVEMAFWLPQAEAVLAQTEGQ